LPLEAGQIKVPIFRAFISQMGRDYSVFVCCAGGVRTNSLIIFMGFCWSELMSP